MSNTGSCLSSANECALGALFLPESPVDCFDMKPVWTEQFAMDIIKVRGSCSLQPHARKAQADYPLDPLSPALSCSQPQGLLVCVSCHTQICIKRRNGFRARLELMSFRRVPGCRAFLGHQRRHEIGGRASSATQSYTDCTLY